MFVHILPNVSHVVAGAAVAARGGLHQGRGDPVVPRPRRAGRHGLVGHDARRGAERAGDRQVVAALRRAARRWRCSSPRSRCSPIRCATRSIRNSRRVHGDDSTLALRSATCDVRFRLGKHDRARPWRASASTSRRTPPWRWWANRAAARAYRRCRSWGCCPRTRSSRRRARSIFGGRDLLEGRLDEMREIRGKDISVIFQEPMTSLNPVFTVGEQIAEVAAAAHGHDRAGRRASARARAADRGRHPRARSCASTRIPHEMSGGQQQRVMIAMAIACEPKLLIADEPTTALDVTIQKQILDLIASLQEQHHMSCCSSRHDLGCVGDIADHVVVMRNGEIQEQGRCSADLRAPAASRTPRRCSPAARAWTGGRSACR